MIAAHHKFAVDSVAGKKTIALELIVHSSDTIHEMKPDFAIEKTLEIIFYFVY